MLAYGERIDEVEGCEDGDELRKKTSLEENIEKHIHLPLWPEWVPCRARFRVDPALKRAGNFSSLKPVSAKQYWATNETHVRYVTILPGRDPNEIVKCRIHLVLGVGKGGIGLHVKEMMLKLEDLDCNCLNGRDFLVIMQGAIMEENNVTRKAVKVDEENWKSYKVFKEMKKNSKRIGETKATSKTSCE
ncbi:hypothetical protein Tco_0712775 [Tanacetum coccineum]